MIRLKGLIILSLAAYLAACRPDVSTLHEEDLALYGNAIDQIVTQYLQSHCLLERDSAFVRKINADRYAGRIDENTYYLRCDSFFEKRKQQLPKCIIEYGPLFDASFRLARNDIESSLTNELQGDFVEDYFGDISVSGIVDTLLTDAIIDWKSIDVAYMDFVPHDTSDHANQYGKTGVVVIALSKIYFDGETNHALVFFEFRSSSNFQRGEIVLLEKVDGYWRAVGFRTIWIT